MAKAIVVNIQIGGAYEAKNLEEACRKYIEMVDGSIQMGYRAKMSFVIKALDGEDKQITIRDEDYQTVAYGNFAGLPSFLDYAREVTGRGG